MGTAASAGLTEESLTLEQCKAAAGDQWDDAAQAAFDAAATGEGDAKSVTAADWDAYIASKAPAEDGETPAEEPAAEDAPADAPAAEEPAADAPAEEAAPAAEAEAAPAPEDAPAPEAEKEAEPAAEAAEAPAEAAAEPAAE